ncbi:rRNA maturation RNase YbeY [Desertibaculum subflavum]|uniref:rRNA maturation RNase YbeY n=1 Tax=Desertibaculum subflavum TaxID=2268458 RepID=UPI0034D1DCA1
MPPPPKMAGLEVEVRITHSDWRRALRAPAALCREAAAAALARGRAGRGRHSIAFLLTDDAEMRRLNRRYRGKNKPTNVLSFPAMPDERVAAGGTIPGTARHLGDVALALETVRREAKEQGKTVRSHVSHLAVHGVLHLIGHDHQNDAEAEAMEALETRILAGLGIADPYRLTRDDR